MTPALRAACERSLHVITVEGAILSGADAVFFIYEVLGYRAAGWLRHPPLIQISEVCYQVVARHRLFFSRFLFTSRGP